MARYRFFPKSPHSLKMAQVISRLKQDAVQETVLAASTR